MDVRAHSQWNKLLGSHFPGSPRFEHLAPGSINPDRTLSRSRFLRDVVVDIPPRPPIAEIEMATRRLMAANRSPASVESSIAVCLEPATGEPA